MPCPFALLVFIPAVKPLFTAFFDGRFAMYIHTWATRPFALSLACAVLLGLTGVMGMCLLPLYELAKEGHGHSLVPDAYMWDTWTPDTHMGSFLNVEDIEGWLSKIGPSGRKAYTAHCIVDLLFYCPAYSVALSFLLDQAVRNCGLPPTHSLQKLVALPFLATLCDTFETSGFLWMTQAHPHQIELTCRSLVPFVNAGKWFTIAASILAILCVNLYASVCGSKALNDTKKTS